MRVPVKFGWSKGSAHGQSDFTFFFYGYLVPGQ
jgi:hypothetical protein